MLEKVGYTSEYLWHLLMVQKRSLSDFLHKRITVGEVETPKTYCTDRVNV
jgi:hypothetical protein